MCVSVSHNRETYRPTKTSEPVTDRGRLTARCVDSGWPKEGTMHCVGSLVWGPKAESPSRKETLLGRSQACMTAPNVNMPRLASDRYCQPYSLGGSSDAVSGYQ